MRGSTLGFCDPSDDIARDLTIGIDETGVRAGIIGEIGSAELISAQEERSFPAAAHAQHQGRQCCGPTSLTAPWHEAVCW